MKQNCVFADKTTRLSCGPALIFDAYSQYNMATENWCYPYLCYGEPRSKYYSEIWTSGMDWTLDFWIITSRNQYQPVAEPLLSFPDNNKVINDCDLKTFIITLLGRDSGFETEYYPEFVCFLGISDEKQGVFTRCTFKHASQPLVEVWINEKYLNLVKRKE